MSPIQFVFFFLCKKERCELATAVHELFRTWLLLWFFQMFTLWVKSSSCSPPFYCCLFWHTAISFYLTDKTCCLLLQVLPTAIGPKARSHNSIACLRLHWKKNIEFSTSSNSRSHQNISRLLKCNSFRVLTKKVEFQIRFEFLCVCRSNKQRLNLRNVLHVTLNGLLQWNFWKLNFLKRKAFELYKSTELYASRFKLLLPLIKATNDIIASNQSAIIFSK